MKMASHRLAATIMLTATLPCVPLSLQAQAPAASSANSFEVASVRAASKGAHETFPQYPSPQFVAENLPLTLLIAIAYDTADNRIVNKPEWLDDTSYTVRAKPDGDAALTEKQYRPLLQDLLRERFKLVVHLETRYVSGYELVLAKGGPKLEPSQPADAMAYILENGLQSASTNTGELASLLSRPLGKPVVDRTGLAGSYKLKLRFAPTGGTASELPDIFTAVEEQLGLKLEAKKVPAEFLVIDHVEKLSAVD